MQPNPIDLRAAHIASDFPEDWRKMSEIERNYSRRIAQRCVDYDEHLSRVQQRRVA